MITEQDLVSAIAECQGEREPNANTCIKLAAFYTIYNQLYGKAERAEKQEPMQMYSSMPVPIQTNDISYSSGTEFSKAIHGRNGDTVWAVVDDLMSTLAVLHPRLYDNVIKRLSE